MYGDDAAAATWAPDDDDLNAFTAVAKEDAECDVAEDYGKEMQGCAGDKKCAVDKAAKRGTILFDDTDDDARKEARVKDARHKCAFRDAEKAVAFNCQGKSFFKCKRATSRNGVSSFVKNKLVKWDPTDKKMKMDPGLHIDRDTIQRELKSNIQDRVADACLDEQEVDAGDATMPRAECMVRIAKEEGLGMGPDDVSRARVWMRWMCSCIGAFVLLVLFQNLRTHACTPPPIVYPHGLPPSSTWIDEGQTVQNEEAQP